MSFHVLETGCCLQHWFRGSSHFEKTIFSKRFWKWANQERTSLLDHQPLRPTRLAGFSVFPYTTITTSISYVCPVDPGSKYPVVKGHNPLCYSRKLGSLVDFCTIVGPNLIELHLQRHTIIQIAISSIKHLGRRVGIRQRVAVGALERILGVLNLFRFLRPFFTTIKVESQVAFLLQLIYVILVGSWTLTEFARSSRVPILRDANDVLSYRLILEFPADDWSESMNSLILGSPSDFQETSPVRSRNFLALSRRIPALYLGTRLRCTAGFINIRTESRATMSVILIRFSERIHFSIRHPSA